MEDQKLNIVVFPWLAFGHMIPHFELSKYLATKGHRVSYVSAPRNLERLPRIPHNLTPLLTLVPLQLPRVENLPPNAEATKDVPADKIPFLMKAYNGLEEPMKKFLEASSQVDWVIHDFNHWLPPLAASLNIRTAFFSIINAWSLVVIAPSAFTSFDDGPDLWPKLEKLPQVQPNQISLPEDIIHKLREAKKSVGNTNHVSGVTGLTIKHCDAIIIRTCAEVESEALHLLEKIHGKPVVPLGLMPPSVEEGHGAEEEAWLSISGWLNKQMTGSVVYVALGSEAVPTQAQFTALASGLEISGLPFFWALRVPAGCLVELPDGFEDRTKDRGLIWTSWAPQLKILAHDSVGAFLTHCGWSSILEALQYGRPLVLQPLFLDQVTNAMAMQEMKVGVRIPTDEDGSITNISVAESLKLVVEDEGGKIYRDEAKKMIKTVSDRNLHSCYLDKFEQYLCDHKPANRG